MASSTTKPVEMVRAIRDRLFRLNPSRYMTPKVPTRERGTATLGMIVADRLRRKRKITSTTRATASISSNCTSLTEARMVVVRSVSTETWTAGGRELCSWGSSFLMRSTTSMTLAPGCRWMLRITAGVVVHPGRLLDVLGVVDRRRPRRRAAPARRCGRRRSAAGTPRWKRAGRWRR